MDHIPAQQGATSINNMSTLLVNLQTRQTSWQQAQQLMAPQLAPDFSPFTIYRNNEVDVSRHLSLLLDPKGTHGQGSLFWDAFVQQMLEAQHIQHTEASASNSITPHDLTPWLLNTKVESIDIEHVTSEGRYIDLCVHTQHGMIAIENKPWLSSKDGLEQLKDYAMHLSEAAGSAKWMLVYLSHSLPSESSWPKKDRKAATLKNQFLYLPWSQMLDALNLCVPKIQAPKVRWFVEDFIQMMERKMGNTDTSQMTHLAAAFNQSPQSLQNALLLRDTLRQWQVSQLKKLENQLAQRCANLGIEMDWQMQPDNPNKKYTHFSLKFNQHPGIIFHVEWYTKLNDESSVYWGLRAPQTPAERTRKMYAALSQIRPDWPSTEITEADWPYWVYLGNDPLFAPDPKIPGADIEHPWLSIDYQEDRNFIELVLKRYHQAAEALDELSKQSFETNN